MSPRRGNLASRLSLFSYQVIAWICSPKCSSISTDSYREGPGWMQCLNLGSFLNLCVWGGIPCDWVGCCCTFRFECSGSYSFRICSPMSGSACRFLKNYLDIQHTLGSSTAERPQGNSETLAWDLSTVVCILENANLPLWLPNISSKYILWAFSLVQGPYNVGSCFKLGPHLYFRGHIVYLPFRENIIHEKKIAWRR